MEKNLKVQYHHLKNLNYSDVWDFQKTLQRSLIQIKRKNLGKDALSHLINPPGHFIICEHNPVYTLGKSGSQDHLLESDENLKSKNIEFFKINRGGDITFHGPGQITGYLILDLDNYYHDVHKYVRDIEGAIIRFLSEYGIEATRIKDFTGVWVEENEAQRKLCAIGVHMSRWVSLHGFALNIHTDLNYFKGIVPCGIDEKEKEVSSLSKELGRNITIDEVIPKLLKAFEATFGFEIIKAL